MSGTPIRLPKINSIWKCIRNGWGHGDVQRVIGYTEEQEVVTISERKNPEDIDWSGLWPATVFPLNFTFVRMESES